MVVVETGSNRTYRSGVPLITLRIRRTTSSARRPRIAYRVRSCRRQLGGGIIAGNSLILLLAWRADSLTAALLVSSVITSLIMAAVGVLACTAPARRALRVQPTEALRQN
ncbi:MAG TPA: hypothetical protein VD833_01645 [Vicinamibacterales bacterium]|nr:hypothetical protein [Vicinamibacterales bacterium]